MNWRYCDRMEQLHGRNWTMHLDSVSVDTRWSMRGELTRANDTVMFTIVRHRHINKCRSHQIEHRIYDLTEINLDLQQQHQQQHPIITDSVHVTTGPWYILLNNQNGLRSSSLNSVYTRTIQTPNSISCSSNPIQGETK